MDWAPRGSLACGVRSPGLPAGQEKPGEDQRAPRHHQQPVHRAAREDSSEGCRTGPRGRRTTRADPAGAEDVIRARDPATPTQLETIRDVMLAAAIIALIVATLLERALGLLRFRRHAQ